MGVRRSEHQTPSHTERPSLPAVEFEPALPAPLGDEDAHARFLLQLEAAQRALPGLLAAIAKGEHVHVHNLKTKRW